MEGKDILPLVGVAFGWLLKGFGDFLKQKKEDHVQIGVVLVAMLELNDELRRLEIHQDHMKNQPGSWAEYEKFRVEVARRYLERRGNVTETVKAAIDLVAGRWPLDALALGNVKVLLTSYFRTELSTVVPDRERYVI